MLLFAIQLNGDWKLCDEKNQNNVTIFIVWHGICGGVFEFFNLIIYYHENKGSYQFFNEG